MKKGSITIFSLLSMMLVVSALVALLEGARFQEMQRISQLQTNLAIESVFAQYETVLWKEYHLLVCSQQNLEEELINKGNARTGAAEEGLNLLLSEVEYVNLQGYTCLTDENGKAYINAVSTYMEENVLYETAQKIYNQYEVMKALKEFSGMNMSWIDAGITAVEEAKHTTESKKNSTGTAGSNTGVAAESKNPLEEIKTMQTTGILELVIEDTSQLSTSEIDLSKVVSNRRCSEGENSKILKTEWMDIILLQQYLLTYLSNYCQKMPNRCLNYELEYVIGKSASDIENLKSVITQLLVLREVANFLYLTTDTKKVEEARLLAIALAGISVNSVIIETITIALLTAWAFAESVLDIRALLCGKQIPLLKGTDTWTLNLTDITSINQGYWVAKESPQGLSYKEYLGILLLFQGEEDMALHAMDVQEATVLEQCPDSNFKMDTSIIEARVEMGYTYRPVFLSFYNLDAAFPWQYQLITNAEFRYE